MSNKLLDPFKIKDLTLNNRVVMSPMCMYSAKEDGIVQNFHYTHYQARAIGHVGLIIQEATAVLPEGRITENDLGIWDDAHKDKLKILVNKVHDYDSKIGIQLAHAGRKSSTSKDIYAPSALAYDETYKTPLAMTKDDINKVIQAFKDGALRAKDCGYDVIEIHGAHGYLINQFLSPVTNIRDDEYGGSMENRYRILKEIIHACKSVYDGPIFVRISANEYDDHGNTLDDYVTFVKWMKEDGVDVVDVSTGGLVPVIPRAYPNYQVPYASKIKNETALTTGTVGIITSGSQALQILEDEHADLIFLGRELLREPNWVLNVKHEFCLPYDGPEQYERAYR